MGKTHRREEREREGEEEGHAQGKECQTGYSTPSLLQKMFTQKKKKEENGIQVNGQRMTQKEQSPPLT